MGPNAVKFMDRKPSVLIEQIPLNEAYRVWEEPRVLRHLENLETRARCSRDPDAQRQYEDFIRQLFLRTLQGCMHGPLYLSELPSDRSRPPVYMDRKQIILCLAFFYTNELLLPNGNRVVVEVSGPAPAWFTLVHANQPYMPWATVDEFQHSDDYSFVIMRGFEFVLGSLQAAVIRRLHYAERRGEPWLYWKDVQESVGCSSSLSDLFKRQKQWRELVLMLEGGRCRLHVHQRLCDFPVRVHHRKPT
jgi:hypothetical protein